MNKCVPYSWHQELVDDCKSIIVETVFTSRWALIEGYHALGQRINGEREHLESIGIKGGDVAKHMAEQVGKSTQTVYNAISLADKFPDINTLPGGKNISWHKVCNEVLPESPKEIKSKRMKCCPKCGHEW